MKISEKEIYDAFLSKK